MTAVRTTTDEMPGLAELLAERERLGLSTYDEWWEGVYRTVTGPTPEHGEMIAALSELLGPLVRAVGLRRAAPVNIGIDKGDCRVPDLGVYHPKTPRTSPAYLNTALLVVEVLSVGEAAGEKMPFYRRWGVEEYLEISLTLGTVQLYVNRAVGWEATNVSSVVRFETSKHAILAVESGMTFDAQDFKPQ